MQGRAPGSSRGSRAVRSVHEDVFIGTWGGRRLNLALFFASLFTQICPRTEQSSLLSGLQSTAVLVSLRLSTRSSSTLTPSPQILTRCQVQGWRPGSLPSLERAGSLWLGEHLIIPCRPEWPRCIARHPALGSSRRGHLVQSRALNRAGGIIPVLCLLSTTAAPTPPLPPWLGDLLACPEVPESQSLPAGPPALAPQAA